MKDAIDTLRQVEIFAGFSEVQLLKLSDLVHRRTVHAGDQVIREGDLSDELYVIESGELSVLIEPATDSLSSRGIPLVTLGRGQVVGEISLIDRGPRSATVRCLSRDASLLVFNLRELNELLENDPAIGYLIMKNLAADMAFKLRQRNIREKWLPLA